MRLKSNLHPREASLSRREPSGKRLGARKDIVFATYNYQTPVFNYTLQQLLLRAPCVRLKPYLRRLDMYLNRLERLEDALKQTKQ